MNEQTAKAAFMRLKDRVLNQEVPRLKHKESAIVIAVITCFVPGLGLLLAAMLEGNKETLLMDGTIALAQFLLTFFFVGWIWALWWAYLMFKRAVGNAEEEEKEILPSTQI